MPDVHCLHCREPWDLHHMMHDLIKDVIMDYGLWPDLREDLLGPMYPDENERTRKAAAAAAKRAEKKLKTRWYKPLKAGKLAACDDIIKAFRRADWLFLNGNVGRILHCNCCEDTYVPLQADTMRHLGAMTTGFADDCYADDRIAMQIVALDPGRKGLARWRDLQEDAASKARNTAAQRAPDRCTSWHAGPYAVVLNGGGAALGIPVPDVNPVYFYRSGVVASDHSACREKGWRNWYIDNRHVTAVVGYQDDKSLAQFRASNNRPAEFLTFEDFTKSLEGMYG